MKTLLLTSAILFATGAHAHRLESSLTTAITSDADTTVTTTGNVAVDTPLGVVIGTNIDPRFSKYNEATVDAFLGIQYASIPSRFSKSIQATQNTYNYKRERKSNGQLGVPYIDATDFGPYCWFSQKMPWYNDQVQSEDCLFLNIWRPIGTTPDSNLSVMVYIHGGFNFEGSPQPPSWGHNLAKSENVIVVSIDYRLGIFGFLATDDDGSNGMNGIDDQIVALHWIHDYINYFGGNKHDVTLLGLGAGSASVCYLSVSPKAEGLFHRAILQSGECVAGDGRPGGYGLISGREGYATTLDVLDDLGASSIEELANPELYPASEITFELFMGPPTLDTTVLPDYPQELYRDSENIIPLEMLIGATTYADDQLVPPSPYGSGVATNLTQFHLEIQADWPDDNVNALKNMYSPSNYGGSLMNAQSQYQGDMKVFCNSRQFASYAANGLGLMGGSVYLYQYGAITSYDPLSLRGLFDEFDNTDPNWATFGSDLVMLLGTYNESSTQWWYDAEYVEPTDEELAISKELMSRWASFAKTGNPNNGVYKGWSPVSMTGPSNGRATDVEQLFFSTNQGTFMQNSASLDDAVARCRAFPNFNSFAVITESPSYAPTTASPSRRPTTRRPTRYPTPWPTRRPSRRPTRRPTRNPTKRPTKEPTNKPSKQPTRRPSNQPTFRTCTLTAGQDPRIPCVSGEFCELEVGVCKTKSAFWTGVCQPIPETCPYNLDPVCACDFTTTYPNVCSAHAVPVNVAEKGACDTDAPTSSPTEHGNTCGMTCGRDADCFHGGFVECPHCNLYEGTQTYKTCVKELVTPSPTTDEPTPSPVTPAPITKPPVDRTFTDAPTPAPTFKPSPEPVTPAPITDEPSPKPSPEPVTPAPITDEPTPYPTPEPITPAPIETPDPTPDPTPQPVTPAPIETPDPTPDPTPQPVTPAPIETPNPTEPPVTPNPTDPPDTPEPTDEAERNIRRESDEKLTASASIL